MLVDGNNLLFRSFFALPRLTRSDGLPNGALHGFASTLRKLLREEAPEFCAVVFDAPGPNFRDEIFPEYKANRPPMPEELSRQIPFTRRLARALGAAVVEVPGVEADDVIGTLAVAAAGQGRSVVVVSGDKDLLQLVDGRVAVASPGDPDTRLDAAAVERKLGVPPNLVPDYLGLVGDSVDNIPGVRGIGPKTAAGLLSTLGGLDEVLARLEEIPRPRTRNLLREQADSALLSRRLARLKLDVPVPEAADGMAGLRYRGAEAEAALEVLDELELRTIARDFAAAGGEKTPPPRVRRLTTLADLEAELRRAGEAGRLSIHAAFAPAEGRAPPRLAAVGLASAEGEAAYAVIGPPLPEAECASAFGAALGGGGLALTGHGVQPFVRRLLEAGAGPARVAHDSQVAAWLLNTTRRAQEFPGVLRDYTGLSLPESGSAGGGLFASGPAPAEGAGLAFRAARQLRLADELESRLDDEEGLRSVFSDIEMPLIPVLARIETRGLRLDSAALERLGSELAARIGDLEERIHELAGGPFDIGSPKQLGEVLFDKLQLPETKKTQKTKRASTRAEVLEELAAQHELPALVLEYRELTKLKSTYVDPLPTLVSKETGRLHTRLHQTVAATGRLSSSDPNLQNIPARTELGRKVRRAFVAAPGNRLLSADYSQIELRVLAHLSGDPALLEAFQRGEDIHARTAAEVFAGFGLDPAEARRRAKIVNFSVIYGKTAFTLGREIGVSTGEAQAFIDAYFARYARVRALIEEIRETARNAGRVTTLFGRQRLIPEIRAQNRARREAAERMAVNAPIQGAAADLIKIAMLGVERALAGTSGALLLQVHDELLVEAEAGEAEAVGETVRREMESAAELAVPLVAEVRVSDFWEH